MEKQQPGFMEAFISELIKAPGVLTLEKDKVLCAQQPRATLQIGEGFEV